MDTKFLIVKDGVRLTPYIEPVIKAMDAFFTEAGVRAYVTSGKRNSDDQLNIIKMYSKRYGVHLEFPSVINCETDDAKDGIYLWQHAWSRLLSKGVIINPPRPARCLFDYMRNGVNKIGTEIGYSPHYYGKAFDIGGGVDHDITNELKVVKVAFASGKIPGFKGFLPERANNAVHIDCK